MTDCQVFSSFNLVGSDHRIVSAKVKLSVRRPPPQIAKKLNWQYLSKNKNLSQRFDNTISSQLDNQPRLQKNYTPLIKTANKIGSEHLPGQERLPPGNAADTPAVITTSYTEILN